MEKLVAERRRVYEEAAEVVVDVAGLSPEGVAEIIVSRLAEVRA